MKLCVNQLCASPSQGGCWRGGGCRAGLISLSPPRGRTRPMGVRSGGASPEGPSGGQGVGGAFGSEGFAAAEHVPDRFGESAGEVDLGDLGAALFAEPGLGALVAVAVVGVWRPPAFVDTWRLGDQAAFCSSFL